MSPVRPRRQRRTGVQWTPRLALALSAGPMPGSATPDDRALRAAWSAFGARVLDDEPPHPAGPFGYWAFARGVPDELRAERPRLVPLEDVERHEAERRALHERRRQWLAEHAA